MQVPIRKGGKYTNTPKDPYITQERYNALEAEIVSIKKRRPAVIEETQAHAAMGDFSENVEYQLAKRKLRGMNGAIERIEKELKNAIIIPKDAKTDQVRIGHTVDILFNGKEKTFTILGANEADPAKRIISHLSPIGESLLGKKVGETFDAQINDKIIPCEIVHINSYIKK
ncbi:GreA/GreB family elongation factor [Patescibacteria group bacterium]|nr:GreA/GreB family elongation factor [Patescibacteria group bacterium]MBU1722145.1 GreA/GreB family elongation factor [Patescibacteria group bacterium]MBU1901194.1 GreA/GreB family elongation factor [Patescibacteria group bacterium]